VLWRPALTRIVRDIESFLAKTESPPPIQKKRFESRH
jgi:hypothetical protein